MSTPTKRNADFFEDAATVDRRAVLKMGVTVAVSAITNDARIKGTGMYYQIKGFVRDNDGGDALSAFNKDKQFKPLEQNNLKLRGFGMFEPSRDKSLGLHFQGLATKEYFELVDPIIRSEVRPPACPPSHPVSSLSPMYGRLTASSLRSTTPTSSPATTRFMSRRLPSFTVQRRASVSWVTP